VKFDRHRLTSLIPFAGLAAVAALFAVITGGKLLSAANLGRILIQSYTVMLAGLGATLIYVHGGIDFSMGSVLALSQMCSAMLFRATNLTWLMLPTTIAVSVACGFITGFVTVKFSVPPFISSLCMQLAGRGILTSILNTRMVGVASLQPPTWGQRLPVLIVITAAMIFITEYTKIGKYNKAIGENKVAAWMSGIDVKRFRLYAYLISGVTLGVAAYFDLLRVGVLAGNSGLGLEMDVLIALVLGGLSLTGGYSSSVRSAVIGSIIVVVIKNGLTIIGLSSNAVGIVQGAVFLCVVLFTYKRDRTALLPR